jgi:ABC-type transport system involved in multi-copper enzyme maturation permease subunit
MAEWILHCLEAPLRLAGPVFGKELRVAGRRRRSYLLRFLYVTFFSLFVVLMWWAVTSVVGTHVGPSSRMAEAGMAIILAVVWFQFLASQLISVVMLSTAISDEIYHKTLGVLMTTPLSSFQIVGGKLASRMLQVTLLLGMSLPLLAIVRVFGGIPWDFLLCTFSVTLTTAVFFGSLSLFHSIFSRKAYAVVIETILVAAVLFILLPTALMLGLSRDAPSPGLTSLVSITNPYLTIGEASKGLMQPGFATTTLWPYHCAISLGGSTLLVLLSTLFVRRAALRQAIGQEGSWFRRRGFGSPAPPARARIRRVVGPPVLWRERRIPLLARTTAGKVTIITAVTGLLVLMYYLCYRQDVLVDKETQGAFAFVLACIGLLATTVLPATCVTSEKESRAWPILLTTPIGNGAILWGKFLGAVQRCSVAWLLLFVHVIIFMLVRGIHPVGAFQLVIIVTWAVVFLCSSGLYFSVRFRHTTPAVIANMALAGGLWAGVPILLGLAALAARGSDRVVDVCLDTNPLVQVSVVVEATSGNPTLDQYDWQSGMGWPQTAFDATLWLLFNLALYGGIGLIFLWRAWARLRRDPCG